MNIPLLYYATSVNKSERLSYDAGHSLFDISYYFNYGRPFANFTGNPIIICSRIHSSVYRTISNFSLLEIHFPLLLPVVFKISALFQIIYSSPTSKVTKGYYHNTSFLWNKTFNDLHSTTLLGILGVSFLRFLRLLLSKLLAFVWRLKATIDIQKWPVESKWTSPYSYRSVENLLRKTVQISK